MVDKEKGEKQSINDRYFAGAKNIAAGLAFVGATTGAAVHEIGKVPNYAGSLNTGSENVITLNDKGNKPVSAQDSNTKRTKNHSQTDKAALGQAATIGAVVGGGVIPAGVAIGKAVGWANKRREEKKRTQEAKQATSRII
jgi:hypothetical protein